MFSLALALRLLYLNKTFDLDEMATAAWAMARTPGEVLEMLRYPIEGNAAGYPLFLWLWGRFGLSEIGLRLPSALAGAFTVLAFFRRNERRFGTEAALWAAALVAVAYFPLLESQNARGYAFYGLFAYLALDFWERGKRWPFAAASWLAISFHHFAFLYVGPLWAVSLWRVVRRKAGARDLLPMAATLLLYLPQVPLLLFQLRNGPTWIPPLTSGYFLATLRGLVWLHGPIATAVLSIPFIAGIVCYGRSENRVFGWALLPLPLVALLSHFRNAFIDQYFFPSCFGFFDVIAAGFHAYLDGVKVPLSIGRALAGATLLCALTGLPAYYATPKSADWRGAADFIKANDCAHAKLVVTDPYWVNRWPFYLAGYEIRHWNEGYPTEPFWLAGAGHPALPSSERALGEKLGEPRWQGVNALVYCIRPEP